MQYKVISITVAETQKYQCFSDYDEAVLFGAKAVNHSGIDKVQIVDQDIDLTILTMFSKRV